ncbi:MULTISPECIES: gp53-like domain-containing protein [Photorhabdus]|uniref:gp53-like domain-containing protein n=1 Tax=Photorhabdus TaxID=29487 RepID=UPI000DCC26CD|nr:MULTISPECIES: phage tail protein [Photorhabdus]MCT8341890.1 phage tail protein [Photorhabdus kleinii]RAX02681.1 phage tail protein [Photorhabdus sp. S9-53]RAX02920.1 phage tail protein [Photorhabdus sp. S10-54]RAX05659.1 phage tail protein [Photorhabdus sp. S8-52]
MSHKNDFKAFSINNNANVVSQPEYEKSQNLKTGFPPEDITTHVLNKALRQSSTIASAVADFIATQSGDDVLDDGDIIKLIAQLNRALEQKIITKISNSALEKTQNGADIPDKNAFVKNLGLNEAAKRQVGTGINQIPDMSFFTKNLNETGWQKSPSGLIEMWGIAQVNGYGSYTSGYLNNFPIPFPNKCFNVTLTHNGHSPNAAGIFSVIIENQREFRCFRSPTNWAPIVTAYFKAIGY